MTQVEYNGKSTLTYSVANQEIAIAPGVNQVEDSLISILKNVEHFLALVEKKIVLLSTPLDTPVSSDSSTPVAPVVSESTEKLPKTVK